MSQFPAKSKPPANLAKSINIPPMPLNQREWDAVVAALDMPPQQARIAELVLCGMRDKEIAAIMGLRRATVRTYLGRLFARAKVSDRRELVLHIFAVSRQAGVPGIAEKDVIHEDDIQEDDLQDRVL